MGPRMGRVAPYILGLHAPGLLGSARPDHRMARTCTVPAVPRSTLDSSVLPSKGTVYTLCSCSDVCCDLGALDLEACPSSKSSIADGVQRRR